MKIKKGLFKFTIELTVKELAEAIPILQSLPTSAETDIKLDGKTVYKDEK
jgi:hypothetical protein